MFQSDCMNNEQVLALLDDPFKRMRDSNHVGPHSILVYDASRKPVIQPVEILELLTRYPRGGPSSQ